MSIKEHLQKVESHCGDLTMIAVARQNRPAGLPKPYEYLTSRDAFLEFKTKFKATQEAEFPNFRIYYLEVKNVSKGVRLDIYVRSWPAKVGNTTHSTTRSDWSRIKRLIEDMLQAWLGKDARVYCSRYTRDGKAVLKYNAYVAFTDRVCLTKRIKT